MSNTRCGVSASRLRVVWCRRVLLPGGLACSHHAVDVLECIFQGFGVLAPIVVIYPLDKIAFAPCFENLVAGGMLVGGILLQKKDEEVHLRAEQRLIRGKFAFTELFSLDVDGIARIASGLFAFPPGQDGGMGELTHRQFRIAYHSICLRVQKTPKRIQWLEAMTLAKLPDDILLDKTNIIGEKLFHIPIHEAPPGIEAMRAYGQSQRYKIITIPLFLVQASHLRCFKYLLDRW